MSEFIGMHGVVRDPVIDPDGRACYCRDECACSHCNRILVMLHREERAHALLTTLLPVVFAIGGLAGVVTTMVFAWRFAP